MITKRAARRRRRRWWIAVPAAVVVLAVTIVLGVQFGVPWAKERGDISHVHRSEFGSQRYQVHLPPQHDGIRQLPVVMAIHGCGMTGYGWNSMKQTTRFNELADREGFIVIYPTQRGASSAINCWNSADPREQLRGSGDPARLAGVAREVITTYGADPSRVHVTGASSGAGTAVILGVTYPDVFATVASIAGGEYGLDQVDPGDPDATPPSRTAARAREQMGENARPVPLMIMQGSADEVVPPLVGDRLAEQWLVLGDLIDDGQANSSRDLHRDRSERRSTTGGYDSTITSWSGPDGTVAVEHHLVHGMGHAWPGPLGEGLFTDHRGPDASALVWQFAKDRRLQ